MDDGVRSIKLISPARRRWPAFALVLGVVLLAEAGWLAVRLIPRAPSESAAPTQAAEPVAAADAAPVVMATTAQQNIGLADAVATVRPIFRTIRATGLVGLDDTHVVRIRPLARGRLLEMRTELGARVRAGQILATYDHVEISDLTGQLAVAQAGLARARAEADAAGKALDRNQELLTIGGVARAELERRTADAARATANVRAQEAEITMIGDKLRRFGVASGTSAPGGRPAGTPIQAPIDGIVVKIDVVPGETVDVDRELFTIADLSTVWVQADVLEKDLPLIRVGLDAVVGVAGYPDRRFAGRVSYVADMLDPTTNTARVRCAVANPDGALKLNMFAAVEIAVPTGRDATTVPPGALQYVDEKPVIFVRKGADGFERRDVSLGVADRDWIEIVDGVTPSEAVVTTGSFQLKSILLRDRIAGD